MVRNKTKNSTKESTESEFAEITFTEEETMDNKTDSSSQRVGGRVKKVKQIFDPSIHIKPKKIKTDLLDSKKALKLQLSQLKSEGKKFNDFPKYPYIAKHNPKPTGQSDHLQLKFPNKSESMKLANRLLATQPKSSIDKTEIVSESKSNANDFDSCFICLKSGNTSEILSCRCGCKAHIECIKSENNEIDSKNHWLCPRCKTCVVCFETSNVGALKNCSVCGDSYHFNCHRPRISREVNDDWVCVYCASLRVKIKTNQPAQSQIKSIPQQSVPKNIASKDGTYIKESNSVSEIKRVLQEISKPQDVINDSIDKEKSQTPTPPPIKPSSEQLKSGPTSVLSTSSNTIDSIVNEEVQEFVGFSDAEALKRSSRESSTSIEIANNNNTVKRGRGRPRKYPRETSAERNIILTKSSIGDKDLLKFKPNEHEIFKNKNFEVPDASKWSTETVYKYFYRYFPESASVFLSQEIDGPSLLLMKRSDIIHGLNLKLGPAVKIYRHISMLQTRNNDPTLTWV